MTLARKHYPSFWRVARKEPQRSRMPARYQEALAVKRDRRATRITLALLDNAATNEAIALANERMNL